MYNSIMKQPYICAKKASFPDCRTPVQSCMQSGNDAFRLFRNSVFHQQALVAELAFQQRIAQRNKAFREICLCTGDAVGVLAGCAGEGLAVQQCGVGVQVQHSDDKRHADVHTILCLLEVHGTRIIVQSHFNFVYTGQRMQYDQILFAACIFLTVRI